MKVCTDSCIFGSYVSTNQSFEGGRVLDVGAGTGLLSLMYLQHNPSAAITAVEPEIGSFQDLLVNIKTSPWSGQISAENKDLATFASQNQDKYQVIICNPPFFSNHLKSKDLERNKALHLSPEAWEDWLIKLKALLSPNGRLWLLLNEDTFEKSASLFIHLGLSIARTVQVLQKGKSFRVIICLETNRVHFPKNEIEELKGEGEALSAWAKTLLQDFYLIKA